jgi:hypothetical protein
MQKEIRERVPHCIPYDLPVRLPYDCPIVLCATTFQEVGEALRRARGITLPGGTTSTSSETTSSQAVRDSLPRLLLFTKPYGKSYCAESADQLWSKWHNEIIFVRQVASRIVDFALFG